MSLVTTQLGGLAALACRPPEADSAMHRGSSVPTAATGETTPNRAAAHAVAAN